MRQAETNSLQSTILATFTAESNSALAARFSTFVMRDWRCLGTWLHASGLALYFLQALASRNLVSVLPPLLFEELQNNREDNAARTQMLFSEFVELNLAFRKQGLDYLNVKGFSIGREYCPNPSLRSQFDLDFWLSKDQVSTCTSVMERLGYRVTAASTSTLEFHKGGNCYPSLREFYKPRDQRQVEIHLCKRVQVEQPATSECNGVSFPSLSPDRQFIQQASHLSKHLRHEWTRASWMLELRNAIVHSSQDARFWAAIRSRSEQSQELSVAIGLATCAVAEIFPFDVPPGLQWAVDAVPTGVARWVKQYGRRVVTAQFPGTKLYLILNREIERDESLPIRWQAALLPKRMPAALQFRTSGDRQSLSLISRFQYLRKRTMFHLRAGIQLLLAERAWKRTESLPTPRTIVRRSLERVQ